MINHEQKKELNAAKDFLRDPYAWPGGYPMFLITSDGGCICQQCARANWYEIASETFYRTDCGWRYAATTINWENVDLFCDHCGNKIESAYGDQG